jgi:hypothetical protein
VRVCVPHLCSLCVCGSVRLWVVLLGAEGLMVALSEGLEVPSPTSKVLRAVEGLEEDPRGLVREA